MRDTSNNNPGTELPEQASSLHYDTFLGPLFFEPYAIEVAKRIDPVPVSVALEIAAGTGRVTRHIRERISSGAKLVASDISESMLAVAKNKLEQMDIEWKQIDAQQLPYADNSIDLVVCCFGYMFVADKPTAFAEVYRVLKPGGQFLFTTWDKLEHNEASLCARTIVEQYLGEALPASHNIATSMHDEEPIRKLLRDAGFSKVSVEKARCFAASPSAREAAYALVRGGRLYEEIKQRNPAGVEEIEVKLEKDLGEKFGTAPMVAPISAVISQAWK